MTDISNSTDSMQGKGLLQSSVCMTTWEEGVGSGWLWGRAAGCSPGIFCNIFPLVVSFTFDWLGPSTAGLIGNNWKKKLVLRRKTFYMGTSPKGAVSDSNPVKLFLSNSTNIYSRCADCPVYVHSPHSVNGKQKKWIGPSQTTVFQLSFQGNQLHSNLSLFLCFCKLLSLSHVFTFDEPSYTMIVMKRK